MFSFHSFLFFFFLYKLFINAKEKVFLDLQTATINEPFFDIEISPSNKTLYLASKSKGLLYAEITNNPSFFYFKELKIKHYDTNISKIQPERIKSLKNFFAILILGFELANNNKNRYFYLYDISIENRPFMIFKQSSQGLIDDNFEINSLDISKDDKFIVLMQKFYGALVLKLDLQEHKITRFNLLPLSNCIHFVLFSTKENKNFMIYHSETSLEVIWIDVEDIIFSKFTSIVKYTFDDFLNQSFMNASRRILQITLSTDDNLSHILACAANGLGWILTINISDMKNFNAIPELSSPLNFLCDYQTDVLFEMYDGGIGILTNYLEVEVLQMQPTIHKIGHLDHLIQKMFKVSENFFIAALFPAGKLILYETRDFSMNDLPMNFGTLYNSLDTLGGFTLDYNFRTKVHFLLDIGNSTLVRAFGGFFEILWCKIYDHPLEIKAPSLDPSQNIQPILEMSEQYLYGHPDKDYFLFYTRKVDDEFYTLSSYSKKYGYDELWSLDIQRYTAYQGRGVKITQINDIAYLIPYVFNGISLIDHIIAVDILNAQWSYTNVEISVNEPNSLINSCSMPDQNENFIFVRKTSDFYLYIYKIDTENSTNLILISSFFIGVSVNDFVISSDCNTLFMGGEELLIVNITSKSNAVIIQTMPIFEIWELKIFNDDYLYIMTTSETLKYDISDLIDPVLLLNQFHPYNLNTLSKNYRSAILSDNYDGQNFNFIYRSFYDVDSDFSSNYSSALSMILEVQSNIYIWVLNFEDLEVGKTAVFKYKMKNINSHSESKKATHFIKEILFSSQKNPLEFQRASWISLKQEVQEVHIKSDKEYTGMNLYLKFVMDGFYPRSIIQIELRQTLRFPRVISSLHLKFDPVNNFIFVESLKNDSITIDMVMINTSCGFIPEDFYGIFLSISSESHYLSLTGSLNNINNALKSIRYYCPSNSSLKDEHPFYGLVEITVNDGLNQPLKWRNMTLEFFHVNRAPVLYKSIQEQFDFANISKFTNQNFRFTFSRLSFIDDDNDQLTYSLTLLNGSDIPKWLMFIPESFELFGIPIPIEDEGNYSLLLTASDGYATCTDVLNFTRYDESPYLKKCFDNYTVYVERSFEIYLPINNFVDPDDGPESLSFELSIYINNETRFKKLEIEDSSIKFNKVPPILFGTPEFSHLNWVYLFIVQASDGLKEAYANFTLKINSSLIINRNSLLIDFSLTDFLSLEIQSQYHKVLIPEKTLNDRNLSIIGRSENLTYLKIQGNPFEISNILSNVLMRPLNRSISSQKYVQSEEIYLHVEDSLGQTDEQYIPVDRFILDEKFVVFNSTFALQTSICVEIGSFFQLKFDPRVFSKNDNLTTNYTFYILNLDGHIVESFLGFSEEDFTVYSSQKIDSEFEGEFDAYLSATDEFSDIGVYVFRITVDHTTLQKFCSILKLIAKIFGPTMSIYAYIKYFPSIYNILYKKYQNFPDKNLFANNFFKWKWALIGKEYLIAVQIKREILKLIKINKINFYKRFSEDIKLQPSPLSSYGDFFPLFNQSKYLKKASNDIIQTISCLVEGFLTTNFLKSDPKVWEVIVLFKEFIIKKFNLLKEERGYWYTLFFEINLESKVKDIISEYFLQTGKFRRVEKHVSFKINEFESCYREFFENVMIRMFINQKDLLDLHIEFKNYLIMSLYLAKRGLLYEYSSLRLSLNRILSLMNMRVIGYRAGDSLLTSEDHLEMFECSHNKGIKSKSSEIKPLFFSLQNKTIPNWVSIEQKRGVLIFAGEVPRYEKKNEYSFKIISKIGYVILTFWILINEKMPYPISPIIETMSNFEKFKREFKVFCKPRRKNFETLARKSVPALRFVVSDENIILKRELSDKKIIITEESKL